MVRGPHHQLIMGSQSRARGGKGRGRATSPPRPTSEPLAACRSRKIAVVQLGCRSLWEPPRTLRCSSNMADSQNQGSAEPSQAAAAAAAADAAAAAEEVMAEGGAQGGDSDSASSDSDGVVGQMAEEPQTPAENAPKPRNDFIESLPNSVKCRVLALKKLQKRCDKIEAKFDKEFQALEKKYNDIYKPLLAKIQELTGEMEGCAWTLEGDEEDDDDDEYEDEEEGEEDEEEEQPAAEAAGTAAAKDEGPHSAVPDDAKK